MSSAQLHERLTRWHRDVRLAMAGRRLDLPFAVYVITDELPDVHDLNLAMVTARVPPRVLLQSVDRVATTMGWRHRRIEVDGDAIAAGLRPALLEHGYREESMVSMALTGPVAAQTDVERPQPPTAVVSVGEQRELASALTAQAPWATTDAIVAQMVEREQRLAGATHARAIVAPPDAPVSRCLLLTTPDGRLAEIDTVGTLHAHRGRRWSDAVVRRAIDLAVADGAEHVMLVADADEWPMAWYSRLGFREVGRSAVFSLVPAT